MTLETLSTPIDFARARLDRAQTARSLPRVEPRRPKPEAANLNREPLLPHAPETSPVEATARRFATRC
jgi:hypothetical protein